MKTVHYWVMRHGQKDPDKDALSDKGFEQVKASAKHNLSSVKFDAAFFSGMHRVKETAETVLSTLGQSLPLTADQGFGFGWAADEKRWPYKEATNQVEAAKAAGAEETADLWMEKWPPALMVRGRMLGSLLYRAQTLAEDDHSHQHVHQRCDEVAEAALYDEAVVDGVHIQKPVHADKQRR